MEEVAELGKSLDIQKALAAKVDSIWLIHAFKYNGAILVRTIQIQVHSMVRAQPEYYLCLTQGSDRSKYVAESTSSSLSWRIPGESSSLQEIKGKMERIPEVDIS